MRSSWPLALICGLSISSCCDDQTTMIELEPEPILVDAGPDQSVMVGATVTLEGMNNGQTASHKWVFFRKPDDSASEIADELMLQGASFVPDEPGEYEIELVGATSSAPDAPDVNPAARDSVTIIASFPVGIAPSPTPRVGIDQGVLKLIDGEQLVDIGPLFPAGNGDEVPIAQLAYDWSTDTLYGINVGPNADIPVRPIFTIDVCTGEASPLGELQAPDAGPFAVVEGLAVDGTGQVYVSGSLTDALRSETLLRVILENPVRTEAAGDFSMTAGGLDEGGDADRLFFASDDLYLTDSFTPEAPSDTWLYRVDVSDPASLADLSPDGLPAELNSLAWDASSSLEPKGDVDPPAVPIVEAIDWNAQRWYRVDVLGGTITEIERGLAIIDGPFAFVRPRGRIAGIARDENGIEIEGMSVFAAEDTVAFQEGTTGVDGSYAIPVRAGLTYTMTAQVVVDSRYMTTEGRDTVDAECGEVEYDIDARRGYYLDATLQGTDAIEVAPGSDVQLNVDYTIWNREGCPSCAPRIIAGIEGSYGNLADVGPGAPFPGNSGATSITIRAPEEEGSFGIFAVLYLGSRQDDASGAPQEFYQSRWPDPNRYIELGTLIVSSN